ncbi:MAG: DUF4214 domain-containing protein [Acidimicrobiales bacterium]
MTRNLARLLLGVFFLVAIPTFVSSPVAAESYPSNCPAMTDSVTRLYLAYFGRMPESAGFNHWVGLYKSGQMSLEEISDSLATSPEFEELGLVTNEMYTTWLYQTLLDRDPTADELDHWVRALGGGYRRGSVTLTLTESYDFVQKTETHPPLSGYLRWYPKGAHWYCDIGSVTTRINPLNGDIWADRYVRNRAETDQSVTMWTLDVNRNREVDMLTATFPAGFSEYKWDGVFSGDGDYGTFLDVQADSTTDWIVVFYPRSIGVDRLGWQISG